MSSRSVKVIFFFFALGTVSSSGDIAYSQLLKNEKKSKKRTVKSGPS